MKYLISPCGIGLGHATRMHALIEELKGEVKVLTYGDAYKYFKNLTKIKTEKIYGIYYKNNRFSLDIFKTLISNLDYPVSLLHNYLKFKEIIDKFNPNFIISDSEPFTLLASKFIQKDVYSFANFLEANEEISFFSEQEKNRLTSQINILNMSEDLTIKNSKLVIIPSFKKEKKKAPKNVKVINPIIRKNISKDKEKVEEKDFYLVSFGGWQEIDKDFVYTILKILKKFKKNFVVSSKLFKKKKKIGNITIYPFINNFIEYMKNSNGIISTAGHSTISEALINKIPMLLMPIKNHLEQLSNAYYIQRKNLGIVAKYNYNFEKKFEAKLNQFIKEKDNILKEIKKYDLKGNGAKQAKLLLKN